MPIPTCDYHVHYHVDGCSRDEMTLPNIDREAAAAGLDEICVLKHYSHSLPNGKKQWVFWKQVVPEQFTGFLEDIHRCRPNASVRMLAGVETELVDVDGTINIPPDAAAQLDAAILSVHWLPAMPILPDLPELVPPTLRENEPAVMAAWLDAVGHCGVEAIIEQLVLGYTRAIERNPKVRVLGHMYDGLHPLRMYDLAVDDVPDDQLLSLMEPLMAACVRFGVLWELMPTPVRRETVLMHANQMGVKFTATVDAHALRPDQGLGLRDHAQAEAYIASLGLTKGVLDHH